MKILRQIKRMKRIRQKRNNTIELNYQSLLEECLKGKQKIITLQRKVILLQQEKEIYKEELIKTGRIDVVSLRKREEKKYE